MANGTKGEVSLQIGEQTYTLALTLDAMVALEEHFSTAETPVYFPAIARASEKGSVRHTRALLWALFQAHHPEVTLQDVSTLVQRAGGLVAMGETLTRVLQATEPDPADVRDLGVTPPNPPTARAATAGTGARSTSGRGARA